MCKLPFLLYGMQKSNKLLIKIERSYVNTTHLENEPEKYDSLHTNIIWYSVSWYLKWDGTYDMWFYQSIVRKHSIKKKFTLNLKRSVWSLISCLVSHLRIFLPYLEDSKIQTYVIILVIHQEHLQWIIHCLFRHPEHTLVYVSLLPHKHIGSILSER